MKIEFENVEFKNFLSYGKIPQNIEFRPGVNLILGTDELRGRSNASGKSSFFETIPFALFGKTNRGINKKQIINWKNKKNCEVVLNFKKGSDNYRILRALKPDKLEIYKNTVLIPPPSDVRVYQKTLENEILNMDFNSSMPLLYVNLNAFTPIFKMDKPQKRKFLERVFNLGFFSSLNEKSNSKLKKTNDNIYKITVNNDKDKSTIKEIESQNLSLTLKLDNIVSSQNDIDVLQNSLDTDDTIDSDIVDFKIKKNEILEDLQDIKEEYNTLCTTLSVKNNELKNIKKYMDEYKVDENILNQLNTKRDELKILGATKDIEELIKIKENEINILENSIKDFRTKNEDMVITISSLMTTLKSTKDRYNKLKDNNKCPLCGCPLLLSGNDVLKNLDNECISLSKSILKLKDDKLILTNKINNLMKDKLILTDSIKDLNTKMFKISKMLVDVTNLESKTGDITKYNDFKDKYIALFDITKNIIKQKIEHDVVIKKKKVVIDDIDENIILCQLKIDKQQEIKNKIDILYERVKQEQVIRDELTLLINDNINKIKELKKGSVIYTKKIDKLNEIIDYFDYIKILCKDENVKQHAIKSKIPYINKQINHYLAESGMNFYVKISNWLEDEILGPGITNCSYGNLSGGESRSIDLSLQFAFLDISRLQFGVYPDILLLDELLDSSVDTKGLVSILNIVKTRQQEDNSKVFLITHRQEIENIDVDNIYLVTKKDGFSNIQLQ